MKKNTAALTGLAALTLFDLVGAPAQAQVQPVPTWTGFYVGGHTGYRWGNVSGSVPHAVFGESTSFFEYIRLPFSGSADSGVVGLQAGYNFLVAPNWLAGVETAWSWGRGVANFGGSFAGAFDSFSTVSHRVELSWSGSVRGRFGFVNDNWLFYGTGGIAFQQVKISGFNLYEEPSLGISSSFSQSKVLFGYVVGAGVERLIVGGWTWRLEYLFADFGSKNFGPVSFSSGQLDSVAIFDSSQSIGLKLQTHTVRMGISKLFQP